MKLANDSQRRHIAARRLGTTPVRASAMIAPDARSTVKVAKLAAHQEQKMRLPGFFS